MNSQGFKEKRK